MHEVGSKCYNCQLTKKNKKKYVNMPDKEAEYVPWETLCINLMGAYQFMKKNKTKVQLWATTL